MKLVLESNLFQEKNSIRLHSLVEHSMTGRHRIEIEDEDDVRFRRWLENLRPEDRSHWIGAIKQGYVLEAREPARRIVHVVATDVSDWSATPPRISLENAAHRLVRPFRVLVENAISDRSFFLRMASEKQREALIRLEGEGFIEFENGNGISSMPAILRRIAKEDSWLIQQYFVLFDSDALEPGKPSDPSNFLRSECSQNGFMHYQLRRRNIENYITAEALRGWVYGTGRTKIDRRRAFDAYISMRDEQRFHFKLKVGFKFEGQHSKSLYESLSDRDRAALKYGFGSDVSDLFQNESVSEGHLVRDGTWSELNPVVTRLLAMLR